MPHTRIERIHAREVFDSRGKPTVEVEVTCPGARAGRAIVPSGASTGRFEAAELRDADSERLDGLGVLRAVEHVRGEIAAALIGKDADDQAAIDRTLCELDGSENKSRLGANAILGVSLATAYAAAEAKGTSLVEHLRTHWERLPAREPIGGGKKLFQDRGTDFQSVQPETDGLEIHPTGESDRPETASQHRSRRPTARALQVSRKPTLPLPMVNMISGGLHAGGNLEFQDFLILPVGAASFRQALEWIITVYRRLGRLLTAKGYEGVLVGDEGGYGPKLQSNSEAVEFVIAAIEAARLRPGEDVAIGLDVASTHFYRDGRYDVNRPGGEGLTSDETVALFAEWVEKYPILSIEDGLAEDDWDGWKSLTDQLGDRVQLIGDDLFVTNRARLQRGIEAGVANSVLIKVNQIGTLWETLETMRLAFDNGYRPVVSARSGETEDATIADLAVATGAGQIKIGSVARSERLAKYNQLLRLEEQLGDRAEYLGGAIFRETG